MNYKVFIGYSSEDDDKAQYIHDCLSRIVEFRPYKAELYKAIGEDFKQRIRKRLHESHFMIVLLTNNGKNSQWVNQEIGFAYALKGRKPQWIRKELPHIIPISEKQVELEGFITKDTLDILFQDSFPSYEYVVANIILTIRRYIPRGGEEGILHLRVTCSNCFDQKGFPYEYDDAKIQDMKTLQKRVKSDPQPTLDYTCPQCKAKNSVDARTFLPHNIVES